MSSDRPNILLLYTGGTIGMMKDPKTATLKPFDFHNLLKRIPELELLDCHIHTVSLNHPIDSSNMNPDYWLKISKIVEENYDKFDGFVVLHGSDTMSYSAAALSFMLENLAKPVIFTGSQLPIGDLRTDAKENLITSIQMASLQRYGKPLIREVGLYFEYKLYRGNRTTKINTEHFEAFSSSNYPILAESGVHLTVNHEALYRPNLRKKLIVHKQLESNILLLKLFPGISQNILEGLFSLEHAKGYVLETFGAGNTMTQEWFLNLLKAVIKRGLPVVNVSQCAGGGVAMGQYETSTKLKSIGVISGKDMTTESALAKMMYMLGEEVSTQTFKTIFETSLRGEMS